MNIFPDHTDQDRPPKHAENAPDEHVHERAVQWRRLTKVEGVSRLFAEDELDPLVAHFQ